MSHQFAVEVEGVLEAVWSPELGPVGVVQVVEHGKSLFRGEGDRAGGGGRRDRAVVVLRRGRAVGKVARRVVARGEAPEVHAVAREAPGVGDAVGALGERRPARVLEVGDALRLHVGVLDVAEVDPAVRVLVPEQRREDHEGVAVVRQPVVAARPGRPGIVGHRVGRRAEGQDVQDHRLVVADPLAEAREAGARLPAHQDPRLKLRMKFQSARW